MLDLPKIITKFYATKEVEEEVEINGEESQTPNLVNFKIFSF